MQFPTLNPKYIAEVTTKFCWKILF